MNQYCENLENDIINMMYNKKIDPMWKLFHFDPFAEF